MPQNPLSREKARDLILQYGWNSVCYQALNDGIERWGSDNGRAMVGYVRVDRMAIVAGALVCAEADLEATIIEWEWYASRQGLGICYFGAETRLQRHLANSSEYRSVVLGSQPEWNPAEFVRTMWTDSTLRAQLNRAKNKGVQVSQRARERAENDPALMRILQEWLSSRGLPVMHFLVEPNVLGDLRDRRLFVAERDGVPVGFVTLCPVPSRSGWLTEQFVRSSAAPNGAVELMLSVAAQAVARDGALYFTMGIVPLISLGEDAGIPEPSWLRFLRRWAKAHYTRFYNFRGLGEFKSKFHPQHWQPVVAIVKDFDFRYSHLRSVAKAFTRRAPELALASGVAKAARDEINRLMS